MDVEVNLKHRRLDQKVAIVLGAGRGIGRAIANLFAAEGAKVLVVGIHEDACRKTADEIRQFNNNASFFTADVTKLTEMEKMANTAAKRYGAIHILCQNAGVYPSTRIEDMTEAQWDEVHAVNLKGTFLAVKACLPQMKIQKYGRIVITSSVTGARVGSPGFAHYSSSKAGIIGFIRTAALEFAKYNITINAVEPGSILTERSREQMGEEGIRTVASSVPLGKLGDPDDVAYATLFLASDEAKYITGQSIVIDGGLILPESKLA